MHSKPSILPRVVATEFCKNFESFSFLMLCFYSVGIFPEQNMADHLSCLSFAAFYF